MSSRWMPVLPTASRWRCGCGLRSLPGISCWTRAGWRPMSPLRTPHSRPTSSRTISRRWIPRISGSSIRKQRAGPSTFIVLAALFPGSVPLTAQTVRISGQVINADSVPLRGIRVVLHRIGQARQGPLDSTRSDARGRFHFGYRADTAAFFLASARYSGIEYFSPPLPTNPARADTAVRILVYDTSSTATVELAARHLVLTRPGEDGSRGMLDLIILRNDGRLTRVAPDTGQGTWSVPLPVGTVGLQVRESDISSEALTRVGNALTIGAALAPGEKQLTLEYRVPGDRRLVQLLVDRAGLPLNVLAEESGVRVEGPGMVPADSQVIQNRS